MRRKREREEEGERERKSERKSVMRENHALFPSEPSKFWTPKAVAAALFLMMTTFCTCEEKIRLKSPNERKNRSSQL